MPLALETARRQRSPETPEAETQRAALTLSQHRHTFTQVPNNADALQIHQLEEPGFPTNRMQESRAGTITPESGKQIHPSN